MDVIDQITAFKSFIELNIYDALAATIRTGNKCLVIDYNHLLSFSPEFAEQLLEKPDEAIRAAELAIEQFDFDTDLKDFRIRIANFSTTRAIPSLKLWNCSVKYFDKLVTVEGEITSNASITSVRSAKFECPSCGNIMNILQADSKFKEPLRCGCGRRGKFRLLNRNYVDLYKITLEDTDESGTLSSLNIEIDNSILNDNDKNSLHKGNRLAVLGILKPVSPNTKNGSKSTIIDKILVGYGVEQIVTNDKNPTTDYDKLLDAITPKDFEELIAKLFIKKGYDTRVTIFVGDRGIDVTANKDGERIAIQCKLFKKNVKIAGDIVQRAIGSAFSPYKASRVMVITSAEDFTPGAYKQVEGSSLPCELWNRAKLITELSAYLGGTEEGWNLYNKSIEEEQAKLREFKPQAQSEHANFEQSSTPKLNITIIKNILSELENKFNNKIPLNEIVQLGAKKGLNEREVQITLEKLNKWGELYFPEEGIITKI